jgi:ELWxxDGT repeat protein
MEIWKSEGSESSTALVTVLNFPGRSPSYKNMSSDTHIFFNLYNTSTKKFELWKTDGTSGNTGKVFEKNLWIIDYESFGSKILFAIGEQDGNNYSLWASDGTINGTSEIKNFGNAYIQTLHRFNDKLIFASGGGTWISDGTNAGTTFLTSGKVDASAIIGNNFYGFGYDFTTNSNRLLKTDGTTIGTTIMNGASGDIVAYDKIPILNNKLILQYYEENVGKELGMSDDTQQNFTLIKDINPGAENSAPRSWATFKNRVYFLADDGMQGSQIWCTDGTDAGTFLLKLVMKANANAFGNAKSSMAVSEGQLHLLASSTERVQAFDSDLFKSDGTEAGTTMKFNLEYGITYLLGRTDKDLIYINERKLYKTNGSSADVTLVKDLSNELNNYGITSKIYYTLGDKLIFALSTYGSTPIGQEYWVTNGTDNGTQILKDIFPGLTSGVSGNGIVIDSKFIFDASDPVYGSELWKSDGTLGGTVLVKDINPGLSDSKPSSFSALNGKVIFSATTNDAGNEVWITDGTEQGTYLLADLVVGPTGSDPKNFTSIGNSVLFTAYDEANGWALWKTDGTALGTKMIKDIIPANDKYHYPINFTAVGSKLFFAADDGQHGTELWISDGTTTGTYLIDIIPGVQSSFPSLFAAVNGVVYFKANAELWRTNGTASGTSKISDFEPIEMISLNNSVYFTAPHPDFGVELFKAEFTKLDQHITFDPIANKTIGDVPFQIIAAASSGLPIVITGGDELEIVNYTATIVKPGTVELIVQQQGDDLFNPAQASQTFCILPSKPSITVTGLEVGNPVLMSSANTGNQWFEQDVVITNATGKTFEPSENTTYKLNVTIDGCTSEFSEETFVVTDIETIENFVSFFPNPVRETLRIKTTGNVGSLSIAIMDINGKAMSAYEIGGNDVVDYSLKGYPTGFYFIRITSEKGISYKKIVKE